MKHAYIGMGIVFIIAYSMGSYLSSTTVYYNYTESPVFVQPYTNMEANESMALVKVPAVDDDGNGVSTLLYVQSVPGTGKTLVNIDKLIFWTDTQNSIRTARVVAKAYAGTDVNDYDLIYTISANASVIAGPSAGGALTVATIASLRGEEPNPEVMMTGTINHDGTIGPVGGVAEKAKAAKEIGAKLFLVPAGQSTEVTYVREQNCNDIGITQICNIETKKKTIDVEEESGIPIIEVGNIEDALQYFLSG